MVAVICVDAYPFWAFSDLTCHLEDTGIGVFWLPVAPDSKETELGSSDQEASPSACKPDNFESHNSLKLSFTNIRGLRSNFVDCESFLESNSPDILALCEINLDE